MINPRPSFGNRSRGLREIASAKWWSTLDGPNDYHRRRRTAALLMRRPGGATLNARDFCPGIRRARARVIVTDNRRHFLAALKDGIRIDTRREFMASEKRRR
jgi:hypothetical protein